MDKNCVIILAAGKGKRMKSELPKVLHRTAGIPMLDIVLEQVKKIKINDIFIVAGYKADLIRERYKGKVNIVYQKEQLGTGHAVEMALSSIKRKFKNVLILYGDMPLVTASSLNKIIKKHSFTGADLTIMAGIKEPPSDFGRIVTDKNNNVLMITEAKDADEKELMIKLVNTGIYCFKVSALEYSIPLLKVNNAQKEKYLTDTVEILVKKKKKVIAEINNDPCVTIGINSRIDLANVSGIIYRRTLDELMLHGVTIIDPVNTYIEKGCAVGKDTVIYPNSMITEGSNIGENCIIGPFTRIINSKVSENCLIDSSVVKDSRISKNTNVGPLSYIRPGTVLGENVRVGNFVEIKKSTISDYTKVPHLSYIGDSNIGKKVNIGAGTITCNYDGFKKHKTIIEDDVYIGANTNLIAPVTVKKGAKVGAGAVVNQNIPKDHLAVGVPVRIIRKIK